LNIHLLFANIPERQALCSYRSRTCPWKSCKLCMFCKSVV